MEMGGLLEYLHRYDEAIAAYRHALELDPQMAAGVHWAIGDVYREKGMFKEHVEEWAAADRGNGHKDRADKMLHLLATKGYATAVRFYLETLLQQFLISVEHGEYQDPLSMADAYIRLGDKKQALAYLNRSYEQRSWNLLFYVKGNVELADDPGLVELAHRMGLP
jgi:tetratricopeptide (TPR) repeat protein